MCSSDLRDNAFRHPTDDQIVVVDFQQTVMEDFLNVLVLLDAFIVSKESRINRFQKFIKVKRISLYIVPYHHRATIRQQGNNFCPSATAVPETLPLYHITVQSERIWVDSAQILFLFSL